MLSYIFENIKALSQEQSVKNLIQIFQKKLIDGFNIDACGLLFSKDELKPPKQAFILSKYPVVQSEEPKIIRDFQESWMLFGKFKKKIPYLDINVKWNIISSNSKSGHLEFIHEQPIFYAEKLMGILKLYHHEKKQINQKQLEVIGIMTYTFGVIVRNTMLNHRLKILSRIDDLTQCYNKRYVLKRLNEEYQRATRYHTSFSVLMIDVDCFKQINDSHGHLNGDRILREFSDVIKRLIRRTDLLGRFGGDEFIVILPRTDEKKAQLVSQKICQNIQDHSFSIHGVTASIGVSTFKDKSKSLNQLIRDDKV